MNTKLIARLCPWAALALVIRCILEYFIEDNKRDFIATVASTIFMAAMLLWAGKKLKEQSKD